jgi:energy-coupling factor transporter ATP-binding protein EcfA2
MAEEAPTDPDAIDPADTVAEIVGLAALLVRPPALVAAAVARAVQARDRSYLVVVGQDGAGKSTLTNALLGREVSPPSRHRSGTVAPVFFRYGDHDSVVYRVAIGSAEPATVTPEEFLELLLQQHNRHNVQQVRRGEVFLRHPLLRRGLQLVDVPGLNSLSPEIAELTYGQLAGMGYSLVLVLNGRDRITDLPKLIRRLDELLGEARVAAVVSNEWTNDPLTATAERYAEYGADRRQAFAEAVAGAWAAVPYLDGLTPENLFCVDLGTVAQGHALPHEAMAAEWARFQDVVAEHVRVSGLAAARAANTAALRALDDAIGTRSTLIADMVAHAVDAATRADLVKAARDGAETVWRAHLRREVADRARAWSELAGTVDAALLRLGHRLSEVETELDKLGELPDDDYIRYESTVNGALSDAANAVAAAFAADRTRYGEGVRGAWEQALREYDVVVPLPVVPVQPGAEGTEGVDTAVGKLGKDSFKDFNTGYGELLTENVGSFIVGVLISPVWLGWNLVHFVRGGNLQQAKREIRRKRTEANQKLASHVGGPLHKSWTEQWEAMQRRADDAFTDAVTRLERRCFEPAGDDRAALVARRAQLEAAQARIQALF